MASQPSPPPSSSAQGTGMAPGLWAALHQQRSSQHSLPRGALALPLPARGRACQAITEAGKAVFYPDTASPLGFLSFYC